MATSAYTESMNQSIEKRIEFGELRIGTKARELLNDCCDKNWASAGPKVKEFEEKWSKLFGYRHSRSTSSGTDAVINMIASLYDNGAKRGDEVIVPALSFIATANAVLHAGFVPKFVDIEKHTLNIDPSKIEAAITDKTRAVLVVHTMGHVCDMDPIIAICKKHGLLLFEDACEAHGAKYKGMYVGNFGQGAAFSYYVAHLICCGEGGMVSTNYEWVAKSVGCTRSHGRAEGTLFFDHYRLGYNSKMNDLEASLGLEGIENFHWTFKTRKSNWYNLVSRTAQWQDRAWFSYEEKDTVACPHGFSITLKNDGDITRLCKTLDEYNIHWKRNFGCIPTQHRAYSFMGHKLGDFPNAEYVGTYGIHLGTHQYMEPQDLDRIYWALGDFFGT